VGVLLRVGLVGFVELFAVLPLSLFNILAEFSHQPCKGPLAKEKVRGLLVFPDLTKRHGARPIAVRFVRPSSRFFADLRAAFVASCFLGAFPPVLLLAVCFVRAMVFFFVFFAMERILELLASAPFKLWR
jgi:hypothetical protein